MFDGNDDKQFQRNQIIAILLMVAPVTVMAWDALTRDPLPGYVCLDELAHACSPDDGTVTDPCYCTPIQPASR